MRPFLQLLAYLSTRHPVGVLTGMVLLTILAAFPAFDADPAADDLGCDGVKF